MLIRNEKPIKIIGYSESTMTQECVDFFQNENHYDIEIITPENFFNINNKTLYQYIVVFSLDMALRKKVCDEIDSINLDCVTYIHNTCVISKDAEIGIGSFISPFSTILKKSKIGRHCVVETYCLISHYVTIGNGCVIHSGTLIGGRSTVGENSTLGFKSSVINNISTCNDVTLGAYSNLTKTASVPGKYIGTIAKFVRQT